jgi:hypothetical protein
MSQWKIIAPLFALSLAVAPFAAGCAAESGDAEESVTAPESATNDVAAGEHATCEAHEACCYNGGPFPWWAGWGGTFPWFAGFTNCW